jgi:hypothetical protein
MELMRFRTALARWERQRAMRDAAQRRRDELARNAWLARTGWLEED